MGQKGSLSYVWAPVGSRPAMVRDNRHDAVYIFGAICPERGVGAAIITPAANMECMNFHLAEISTQVAPGSIAAVICDGAGWHQRGRKIKLPHNIVLLPLPPYAPELNSMENVWDYLRANKLSACVWDGYNEILAACADAWNWLVNDPVRIRRSRTGSGTRGERGKVHHLTAPHRRGVAAPGLLLAEARRGARCGWDDLGRLRRRPGGGVARP